MKVNQSWWGHKAKKVTWLYICGIAKHELPAYPLSLDAVTHIVASGPTQKKYRHKYKRPYPLKELSKRAREATPPKFARWLIDLARLTKIE